MTIKLRALVKHPSRIEGDTGVAVESANGVVTVALDLAALVSTASIADPAATTVPLVTPGLAPGDPGLVERIAVSELLALATNFDAELAAIAGLASAADKLPYFTGSGTAALADVSAFGRTLIDDAGAAAALTTLGVSPFAQTLLDDATAQAARTTLGLVIGTDVQAQDAKLSAIAGLAGAADKLPYFTGPTSAALADVSPFGRSLLDDASAAAARTTLGTAIGTDVQAFSARLADIAGISFAQGDVLYHNGASIVKLARGADGTFLKSTATNPVWDNVPGGGDMLAANNLSDVTNAATAFGNIKQAATDAVAGVVELATASEMVTDTDIGRVPSVSVVKNSPGVAKAWAIVASNGTLIAGYNASATRNSTGVYAMTFLTPMASANYAVVGTAQSGGALLSANTLTASSFGVDVRNLSNTFVDSVFMLAVYGHQ